MPQLIAMVIIVVGAMIYMFQTFGGTGDKIEAVAQKSVILTEINNIKDGMNLANKTNSLEITTGTAANRAHTLEGLADLEYFDKFINTQITTSAANTTGDENFNIYKGISLGGDATTAAGSVEISLVVPTVNTNLNTDRPGLFVKLQGDLADNAGFLETQLASDLAAIAYLDRNATADTDRVVFDSDGEFSAQVTGHSTTGTDTDGMFTIYYKDLQSGKIKE